MKLRTYATAHLREPAGHDYVCGKGTACGVVLPILFYDLTKSVNV